MTRKTRRHLTDAPAHAVQIVREYGPFADHVHGITYDGSHVWAARRPKLVAFDPGTGKPTRTIDRIGDAGTAFDGKYLYQITEARIDKIDPATGEVVASIPAPGHGRDSGLAWSEGRLWVGSTAIARSTRSILKPGWSCAPSSPTASLPA